MDIKMNASFCVDHRKFGAGLYISRIDGDITTYDMRFCKPNTGDILDNVTMHTIEHLFSTYIRNSDLDVIYFGPMGCQTGFYLLVRNADNAHVLTRIREALEKTANHTGEIFGASEIECGNYKTLALDPAREITRRYLAAISGEQSFLYY